MSDLKKKTFLSYQPITKREGVKDFDEKNINLGNYRTEAILKRDQIFVDRLGYNPYWAIGGETTEDIMLGSLFCAPNVPQIAHIFQTDEYIRINKIKQENHAAGFLPGESLDYIDNTQPDVATEFMVKDLHGDNPRANFMYNVLSILNISEGGHVIDGFGNGKGYFINLSQNVLDYWDYCAFGCYEYVHKHMHIDTEQLEAARINPKATDLFCELNYTKTVFEMVILPVILEILSPDNRIINDVESVKFSSTWFTKCAYTFKRLSDIRLRFTDILYNNGLTEEVYLSITDEARKLIISDKGLLEKMSKSKKIYPNDACPCGSGKKYKKCHGRIFCDSCWG